MSKTKIDGKIWASIQYGIADIILKQSFTNSKLNQTVKEDTDLIYHYTTPEKFISILTNQSFYFTNLNYLNDRKEFHHGVDLILKVVDKLSKESKNKIILEKIKNNINYIHKSPKYVSCFSCNGDLLSQWRAYANDGKGISVGFDVASISQFDIGQIESKYILYDENGQIEMIEEIIEIHIDLFNKIFKEYDWGEYRFESLVATSILDFLEGVISIFKHPSFSEEREFRLEWKIDGNIITIEDSDVKFRSTESLIIPYINLLYLDWGNIDNPEYPGLVNRLPIKEIIIGPSLEYEPNKQSIELLLKNLGYDNEVKIFQSKIPYRI
jgi:hypothetical protein